LFAGKKEPLTIGIIGNAVQHGLVIYPFARWQNAGEIDPANYVLITW
jgi:hypothetical protein